MVTDLIFDRGRGPEVVGTRITVYNLLPYFLDPTATEEYICRIYELTPEQVAAARAYVLNNPDTVLTQHLKIEERIAAGNPPEVIEKAKKVHAAFLNFKEWLTQRNEAAAGGPATAVSAQSGRSGSGPFPAFDDWLAERESRPAEGP